MIKPLSELVEPGRARALANVKPTIHHADDFLRTGNAAGHPWLPASHNILCAFIIPLDSIKMLIVGQDPYPTPGHPMGLSFYVVPNARLLPKSLINTYKELVDDFGAPMPTDGDLTSWTGRGVMLLNRCLVVGVEWSSLHQGKGWEEVTETAIRALNTCMDTNGRPQPLVAIPWGRNAQDLEPLLTNTLTIKPPRLSPLSASRGFFGSKLFFGANQALVTMGAGPVD